MNSNRISPSSRYKISLQRLNKKPEFSEATAREVFPLMAEWMQLPGKDSFSYRREVKFAGDTTRQPPNIILVQCESFSMYKTSMSANPLNATPFFNSLSKNGIFFDRCFTPHCSTARALFATLTGIPDAQLFKFSTRIPEALDQHERCQ